jgi:hypothetical protein
MIATRIGISLSCARINASPAINRKGAKTLLRFG